MQCIAAEHNQIVELVDFVLLLIFVELNGTNRYNHLEIMREFYCDMRRHAYNIWTWPANQTKFMEYVLLVYAVEMHTWNIAFDMQILEFN